MFRVKQSDLPSSLRTAARIVIGLQVSAWAVGVVLLFVARGDGGLVPGLALASLGLIAAAVVMSAWLWRRSARAQQALRQVKLLAHDILASMDHGVVTTDAAGLVTSINTGAMRLLGADESCVGRSLSELTSDEIPLAALGRRVIEHHEHVRDQEYTLHGLGQSRMLLASAQELNDTNGRSLGCVIHIRDITERMRMKEQMWRLQRFVGLSTLASGLHHEIKNPLTALSLHVQLLEERLRESNATEAADGLLGVVKAEVHRLTGVLERFRTFASLERLTLRPTNVIGVLDDLVRFIRPQAEEQGVRLTLESPEPALPPVPLDAEKFREAVLNLMVNALEAMPEGGALALEARGLDSTIQVEVRDTGPGIPPEVGQDLFQPYVTSKERGSGIGLALVEKLISQHGGHVTYQSSPQGTTFLLNLPLAAGSKAGVNGQP
jgi:PAS domain S-box-containing protein